MRKHFLCCVSLALLTLIPATAIAQNTDFSTAVHLLVGQSPVRVTLPTGSADRFYDAPVVQNHSYCAEATASESELNPADPALVVYRLDQTTSLGPDIGSLEPKGATAARVCFIAPATELVFIKLSPESPSFENREYSLRFLETTLWANWFFVGGDYSSYSLLRNTTNTAVTVDLRWFAATGATVATRLSQTVPANGVLYIDARSAMGCGVPGCSTTAGSVQVAHSASPEAIVGSQTTLSASTGLSFDTILFQRRTW
jgi:hypothetical protein